MTKPKVITNSTYNINELSDDRKFEELIHRIFEYRINDDLSASHDKAILMPGVAEKGKDVSLIKDKKNNGAIQCKMNTSGNLDKPTAAKEIIKFALYYHQDNSLIDNIKTFKYYFICSGKFTQPTSTLLTNFKETILKETNFKVWTQCVLNKYTCFKDLNYSDVEKDLKRIVSKLEISQYSYSEINGWLNKYPTVAKEFFDIKMVIDNEIAEEIGDKIINIISPDLEEKAKSFISSYKKIAKGHLDSVQFIGLSTTCNKPRNITVSKLYVEPLLDIVIKKESNKTSDIYSQNKKKKEIKIHDILKRAKHYIILGDPGAGKSLLIKNLILRILNKGKEVEGINKYKYHIPFRIELRKYNAEVIKNNTNLISYISSILTSEYQIPGVDEKTIQYLITNRNTFLFFDGLDEIFDLSQKRRVCDDIVNFISLYNNVKCIITSRFIGYHDITFPEDLFEEFSIKGFNDKQREKFVEQFYKTQISNKVEREKEIANCNNQLRDVAHELKSNPLILSLMSLLAINKIVIPDSKLEVYKSCTNTLVNTRDIEEKQLKFNVNLKHIRGGFCQLGFWQYKQMTERNKITRSRAEKIISNYLNTKNEFEDKFESDLAAKNFLDYAEKRSIYFDNMFMHKTFLEYYTADCIYMNYHNNRKKQDKRDEILCKYISNSAWHIVFELLFSMIDEQVDDNDELDNIISTILDSGDTEEMYCFLLSIIKNTTNISTTIKERIISKSINKILSTPFQNNEEISLTKEKNDIFSVLKEIYSNIQPLVINAVTKIEQTLCNKSDLIDLYTFICEFNDFQDQNLKEYLFKVENLDDLINEDLQLFLSFNMSKQEGTSELVKRILTQIDHFGLESLFRDCYLKYNKRISWIGIFTAYLYKNKFEDTSVLKKDLLSFASKGLTIDFINDNIETSHNLLSYHLSQISQLHRLVEIYITSDDLLIENFIYILLSKFIRKSSNLNKEIREKYKDNKKYDILVKKLNQSKDI